VEPLHVGHRLRPPDGRQVPLVDVAERLAASATQAVANEPGGVAALLHRDRREAGQRRAAVGRGNVHHVAERQHLGVAGQREVGLDGQTAGAIHLGAGQLAELPREG
jgi:hypothetical protein